VSVAGFSLSNGVSGPLVVVVDGRNVVVCLVTVGIGVVVSLVRGLCLGLRLGGPLVVVVDVGSVVVAVGIGTVVAWVVVGTVRGLGFGLRLGGPLVVGVVGVIGAGVVGMVMETITIVVGTTWLRLSLLHLRSASGSRQKHKHLKVHNVRLNIHFRNHSRHKINTIIPVHRRLRPLKCYPPSTSSLQDW